MLKLANKVERDNNFPYEKVLAVSTDLIPYWNAGIICLLFTKILMSSPNRVIVFKEKGVF